MYVQFYNKNTGRQESAFEIRRATGLDPETAGPEALETVGVYPIESVDQPFNVRLFDLAVNWDTSTGYAVKSWTPTAKTLADVLEGAKDQRSNSILGRIRQLRRISKFRKGILSAADGIDDSVRPARFDKWVDRVSDAVTELDTDMSAIEGAATVDAINNIVSPAHGTVKLALDQANPLNLLAGDFEKFYSKNYANTDLELFFPSTSTTIAYSSGFAATASVVTADDPIVQIRVASTGVVVDEIALYTADSSLPLPLLSFGYLKYNFGEITEDQDYFDYTYAEGPTELTVTVSGGKFLINGKEQQSLELTQGKIYRFNQEDSSNAGHPLMIYDNSDKDTEIVARVTTAGTPGSAGAYTEYIPGKAGYFSYQCSVHAAMGGDIHVVDTYRRSVDVEGNPIGGGVGYEEDGGVGY